MDTNYCFILYIGHKLRSTKRQGGGRKAGTTEKGPNDAGCVVLALGVCFFLFVLFQYLLVFLFYVYRFYSMKYATEREMGCANDKNGPK